VQRSSSTLEFHTRPNSALALIGSLLLLGASFTLLVLGPSLLGRFQGSTDSAPGGGYLNIAAASGIALGGGAAMIAVVARLVRDIELRPYAVLGPVLSVFTGFVLWGLRAELPWKGVQTEYLGVFALAVSVAGGALIAQRGSGTRPMGWLLAFFAPAVLLGMLWANSGQANGLMAYNTLAQPVRMFMGVLAGAAFVLCLLGEVARALRMRSPFDPDFMPLPRSRAGYQTEDGVERVLPTPQYGSQLREPGSLREAIGHSGTDWRDRPIPSTDAAYLLQSQEFDQPREYTPKVSVWDYHDDNMTLPSKHYGLKALVLLVLIVGGGGAAMYYGSILPNQQKERAVQAALQQRAAQLKAAEQAEAEQKRADEAKAAAARLEELLKSPAPAEASAAAATGPGAKPAPVENGKQAPNLDGASAIQPAQR
jgi:hypothetical protein